MTKNVRIRLCRDLLQGWNLGTSGPSLCMPHSMVVVSYSASGRLLPLRRTGGFSSPEFWTGVRLVLVNVRVLDHYLVSQGQALSMAENRTIR